MSKHDVAVDDNQGRQDSDGPQVLGQRKGEQERERERERERVVEKGRRRS